MLNNSMALLHVSHHPVQTYRVRTSYIFNIAWTLWVLDPITNPSFGRAPAAPCYNKTSSWFLNRNTASQVSMARNIPTNEKQRWATKTTLPIKSLNCPAPCVPSPSSDLWAWGHPITFNISWTPWVQDLITNPSLGGPLAAPSYTSVSTISACLPYLFGFLYRDYEFSTSFLQN